MIYNNNNLIIDPDPLLRQKSAEVKFPLSKQDYEIAIALREYVVNSQSEEKCEELNISPAVGIAAVQIGELKRICVVYFEDSEGKPLCDLTLFNPKIIAHSVNKMYLEDGEACLSIKDEHIGYVNRYCYVKVKYQDFEGKEQVIELQDFAAIAVQHEIDHLNGVLFYDHINKTNPFTIENNSEKF